MSSVIFQTKKEKQFLPLTVKTQLSMSKFFSSNNGISTHIKGRQKTSFKTGFSLEINHIDCHTSFDKNCLI
jgi:hypothetical protein